MAKQRLKIVIVGAGLGGLTAAYCFARDGHDVELYERKSAFDPRGGTIMIRPGAGRCVSNWGLSEPFEAVSDVAHTAVYRSAKTGEVLHRRTPGKYSEYPDWGSDRKAVQMIFHEQALKVGAKMYYGRGVQDVSETSSSATVTLISGESITANVVFAADGVLSRLRSKILRAQGPSIEPVVADATLHQVELQEEELLQDPEAKHLAETTDLTVTMDAGAYVVGRWNSKLRKYNAIFAIAESDHGSARLWDEHGDIESVRKAFREWNPQLRSVLQLATSCDRWKIADMPDMPEWISEHGRMALLGDSAHSMLPDAAQGYSQIVEDIQALSVLLSKSGSSGIPAALKIWQDVRKPRVEKIKALAHSNHYLYSSGGLSLSTINNGNESEVKSNASAAPDVLDERPDDEAPYHTDPFNRWLYNYDVAAEINKAALLGSFAAA